MGSIAIRTALKAVGLFVAVYVGLVAFGVCAALMLKIIGSICAMVGI